MPRNPDVAYGEMSLPVGIRSRFVDNGNGLVMHVLEAGYEEKGRPCVLLLHGFPELAYSWRIQMTGLASAGYRVIAPDQRGYGRTIGGDVQYDGEVSLSHLTNLVRDTVGLVSAFGLHSVLAVVGHDFGSPVAAWCGLLHPDIFRSVVLLSAPFAGPSNTSTSFIGAARIERELAALCPPRKHYQWYYSTRDANDNMRHCPQGVRAFLREYYHVKSADWTENTPFPLKSWGAEELAKLPRYYIMDLDEGMAETVARHAPTAAQIAACKWLPEDELCVYSDEFARTGFQGGLQWYRCMTDLKYGPERGAFSGRTIDVPVFFIGGRSDWGIYQAPGALESMASTACTKFKGVFLIEGAGHWVQQERPDAVTNHLKQFLAQQA